MRVVIVLQTQTAQEMQSPSRGTVNESVNPGIAELKSA